MKYTELIERVKKGESPCDIVKDINIKPYLAFNVKYGIANMLSENVLEYRENGLCYISHIKCQMIEDLLVLRYADIEKEDSNYNLEDYDLLAEKGVFNTIKNENSFNRFDYELLINELHKCADQIIEEKNRENSGIVFTVKQITFNLIDQLVDAYTDKEKRKEIKKFLNDLNSNTELLDTVNNLLAQTNLSNAKDLLLKKIKEVERDKKEAKKQEKKTKVEDKTKSGNKDKVE